jgi:hypothetical protein
MALLCGQSVSVLDKGPDKEDTMTVYIIRGTTVAAHATAPRPLGEGEVLITTAEDIALSPFSLPQLVAIWNAIAVRKFKDRNTAVRRLWTAFSELPVEREVVDEAPAATSKQSQVVALLQRPEGATVDEMAAATGWQHHSVRGLISGGPQEKAGS